MIGRTIAGVVPAMVANCQNKIASTRQCMNAASRHEVTPSSCHTAEDESAPDPPEDHSLATMSRLPDGTAAVAEELKQCDHRGDAEAVWTWSWELSL